MLRQCPNCNSAYCACSCQPSIMKQAGSAGLLKLAPYEADSEADPVVYAIRSMKKHPRARVVACCGEELVPLLRKAVEMLNEKRPISHTVIAYIPRAKKKVLQYGFDQAKLLANAVGAGTGFPVLLLLRRVRGAKEQKGLTQKERRENLRGAFALSRSPAGWRVILVDDVVTTGAGMAEAARVCRRGGATEVLCLCVAMTAKRKAKGG